MVCKLTNVQPEAHPVAVRHQQRGGDVRGGRCQHGVGVCAPLQLVEVGPLLLGQHRLARLAIDIHLAAFLQGRCNVSKVSSPPKSHFSRSLHLARFGLTAKQQSCEQ